MSTDTTPVAQPAAAPQQHGKTTAQERMQDAERKDRARRRRVLLPVALLSGAGVLTGIGTVWATLGGWAAAGVAAGTAATGVAAGRLARRKADARHARGRVRLLRPRRPRVPTPPRRVSRSAGATATTRRSAASGPAGRITRALTGGPSTTSSRRGGGGGSTGGAGRGGRSLLHPRGGSKPGAGGRTGGAPAGTGSTRKRTTSANRSGGLPALTPPGRRAQRGLPRGGRPKTSTATQSPRPRAGGPRASGAPRRNGTTATPKGSRPTGSPRVRTGAAPTRGTRPTGGGRPLVSRPGRPTPWGGGKKAPARTPAGRTRTSTGPSLRSLVPTRPQQRGVGTPSTPTRRSQIRQRTSTAPTPRPGQTNRARPAVPTSRRWTPPRPQRDQRQRQPFQPPLWRPSTRPTADRPQRPARRTREQRRRDRRRPDTDRLRNPLHSVGDRLAARAATRFDPATREGEQRTREQQRTERAAVRDLRRQMRELPYEAWSVPAGARESTNPALKALVDKVMDSREPWDAWEAQMDREARDFFLNGEPGPPKPSAEEWGRQQDAKRAAAPAATATKERVSTMAQGNGVDLGLHNVDKMIDFEPVAVRLHDTLEDIGRQVEGFVQLLGGKPIDQSVVEKLTAVRAALAGAAQTAQDVQPQFRKAHEADIARHEAPRPDEQAWDVG